MTADVSEYDGLLNDLYQLTMAASFFRSGMNEPAVFNVSVRKLPLRRAFIVGAGVESVLQLVEKFHFSRQALDYLSTLKIFDREFLDFLASICFSGEVRAIPEGTFFFAEEPLVEIRAPLIEVLLLETGMLNQLGFASTIASKAARCFIAAAGRRLIDFGFRRAHGVEAGVIAARSSFIAGFHGTSNLLAGEKYGIPVFGTMGHSYIMSHDTELQAFEDFMKTFPQLSTILVDTYDTPHGVENAAAVALKLRESGATLQGIRLDSGDLLELSRRARRILDRHHLGEVAIFASGGLDEFSISDLVKAGAPIDAFGVGTALVTSADAPALDINCKLVEYKGSARIKTSTGKASMPGSKQVFRAFSPSGAFYEDLIGLAEESATTVHREFKSNPAEVRPLLETRMRGGRRTGEHEQLQRARDRFAENLGTIDPRYKVLDRAPAFPVRPTAALNALIISEKLAVEKRQS